MVQRGDNSERGFGCRSNFLPGRPDAFVKKIAQNLAQPVFLSKSIHNFFLGRENINNAGFFSNLTNYPK
jgi:hypothetical protein